MHRLIDLDAAMEDGKAFSPKIEDRVLHLGISCVGYSVSPLCCLLISFGEEPILHKILFVGCTLALTVIIAMGTVSSLRRSDWLGAEYYVTSEFIVKTLRSGVQEKGYWNDLVALKKRGCTLEFRDGVTVSLERAGLMFGNEVFESIYEKSGRHRVLHEFGVSLGFVNVERSWSEKYRVVSISIFFVLAGVILFVLLGR